MENKDSAYGVRRTMARLALVLSTIITLAATVALAEDPDPDACSHWLEYCLITDQCCEDLECLPYAAKCIPKRGSKLLGKFARSAVGSDAPDDT